MRYIIRVLIIMAVLMAAINVQPAFGTGLKTEGVKEGGITGNFTLILYGGRFFEDAETVALLDLEGDRYAFEPYAPDFDFRVIKGLPAKEALEMAQRFVSIHPSFWRSQISRILDNVGRTVGYEVRPLYRPLAFGLVDVMDVDYALKGDKIRVYIRLKPEVERSLFGGGGPKDSGH